MENADSQPPRCPCGFWGSSQTLNLCSKCYKELQRSGKTEDNNAEISGKKDVVQTSNRSGSKQDLGKECSSEEINTEDQCHTNSLECNTVKTETESSSLGNISQEIERDKEQQVGSSSAVGKDLPVQKKRKRCWTCKTKLELAQRELGNCRCSYVFCHLHRLPEQHNCVFDHKESGRREARSKMVSPGPKKVGRSFQRIDE